MRVIEWRIGAHAHEFLRADLDHRDAEIVVEMGNDMVGHNIYPSDSNGDGAKSTRRHRVEIQRTILAAAVDSHSPGRSPAYANSTQSCRSREALLSSRIG